MMTIAIVASVFLFGPRSPVLLSADDNKIGATCDIVNPVTPSPISLLSKSQQNIRDAKSFFKLRP